jgi:DNA-binding transcriptional ArsR family regulator
MIDEILQALVDPRRREILELIREEELPAGKIAAHFDVSRPAISQHLRVLEESGLATVRKYGTQRLYRVRPQGFAELRKYLESYWDVRLLRLKRAAEDAEAAKRKDDGGA